MATWLRPAKKSPSPTSDWSKIIFSPSVKLNTEATLSIDDGDCFKSSCKLELETTALPYLESRKSSTSWEITVKAKKYLRARLARPNRKRAVSSCCIIHQASSIINIRGFKRWRTVFQ